MSRTQLRLAGFAVVLAALFSGGYAVGDHFPLDDSGHDDSSHDDPGLHDDMDHGTDPGADPGAVSVIVPGADQGVTP